jgi:steroid delta-isomerase-like uncharacterized protein
MGTDNAIVARRFITEIWGKGNLDAIAELVDENIVVKDNAGTDKKGIAAVKEMVKMMKGTFSDNSFTFEDVIVAGDRVALRLTWHGKHTGDFFGVKPTGKTLSSPGAEFLRIVNGKVVEEHGFMDLYAMFRGVGALPAPDALVKKKDVGVDSRA